MSIVTGPYTAAITALESQRTAYHRYARMVETQRMAIASSHPDRLVELAHRAGNDFQELEAGARDLRPKLEAALSDAATDPGQARELDRVLAAVRREALDAERQIRELTEELGKWRDDVARRLIDLDGELPGQPAARGYGPEAQQRPMLIDRKG